jgi:hypothetical protein
MKILSWLPVLFLVVSVPHAYDPVDEQSTHKATEPSAADSGAAPVTMPFNPAPMRILGWGLATTGLVMAVAGTGLVGENDGCSLIQGFNCDEDRQHRQFWLLGGGALIGSLGAVLIWTAEVSQAQRSERAEGDTLSAGSPPVVTPPKNMWVGMGLGLAGSAVGTALFWNEPSVATGMLGILAPSLGQAYAGTTFGTAASLAVRGLGGFMLAKNYMDCKYGEHCDSDYTAGRTLFMTGVAISLLDTWTTIRRSDRQARKESASTFSFAPALFPVGHGRLAPGLAFNTMF